MPSGIRMGLVDIKAYHQLASAAREELDCLLQTFYGTYQEYSITGDSFSDRKWSEQGGMQWHKSAS